MAACPARAESCCRNAGVGVRNTDGDSPAFFENSVFTSSCAFWWVVAETTAQHQEPPRGPFRHTSVLDRCSFVT